MMPSDKNSTARGTSFRQRVKERGGVILPAVPLWPSQAQAMDRIRRHLERGYGRAVTITDIVKYAIEKTDHQIQVEKES